MDIATIKAREEELRNAPPKPADGTTRSTAERHQAVQDFILRRGLQAWDSLRKTSENALRFGEQDPDFENEESVFYDLSLLLILFPNLKTVYLSPLDFRQWTDGRYTKRQGTIVIKWPPRYVAPVNGFFKARGVCLFPVIRFYGKWCHEKELLTFKDCILLYQAEPEEYAPPAAGPVHHTQKASPAPSKAGKGFKKRVGMQRKD